MCRRGQSRIDPTEQISIGTPKLCFRVHAEPNLVRDNHGRLESEKQSINQGLNFAIDLRLVPSLVQYIGGPHSHAIDDHESGRTAGCSCHVKWFFDRRPSHRTACAVVLDSRPHIGIKCNRGCQNRDVTFSTNRKSLGQRTFSASSASEDEGVAVVAQKSTPRMAAIPRS